MLVDSHCHLEYKGLIEDRKGVLERARAAGVGAFLNISTRQSEWDQVVGTAAREADVFASVGIHPHEADAHQDLGRAALLEATRHPKVIAIGETGLDYFRSEGNLEWQQDRFRHHIRAAIQAKKPLIIHTREVRADTLRILREEKAQTVGGVLHCFTEDWDTAKAALDMNFYISLSGILTFRNAEQIQSVARQVPEDRLLIETDSPYLAPIPMRGKPNYPAYVRHVAEFLAGLRGMTVERVAELTTANFFQLFAPIRINPQNASPFSA